MPLVSDGWRHPLSRIVFMLFIVNLFWPILNLLPIWPLDGGRICREVLEAPFGHKGILASLAISILVSACLAIQVLLNAYGPRHELIPYVSRWVGTSMWNALFFALFAVSSFQALQAEQSRNRWDDELPWERR
jgi:Zn-dependent protease